MVAKLKEGLGQGHQDGLLPARLLVVRVEGMGKGLWEVEDRTGHRNHGDGAQSPVSEGQAPWPDCETVKKTS